jgi:hypothetical protein
MSEQHAELYVVNFDEYEPKKNIFGTRSKYRITRYVVAHSKDEARQWAKRFAEKQNKDFMKEKASGESETYLYPTRELELIDANCLPAVGGADETTVYEISCIARTKI